MKVISFSEKQNIDSVICLGRFDGLHKGHRKLIEEAKKLAAKNDLSLSLFTIRPKRSKSDLLTFDEFTEKCRSLGIETIIYAEDEPSFFDTAPADFLNGLKERFSARCFVLGKDFTYGKAKRGNAKTLEKYCKENSLLYKVVDIVEYSGIKISSTDIKNYLINGEIKLAKALLLDEFSVRGEVIRGRSEGSRLGFSTANINYPDDKVRIKRGVYATRTVVEEKEYNSISNFGSAPTFGFEEELLETHIIDYDGDLYGKKITIKFVDFIRENKKFADKDQLIDQLNKDKKYYD